MSVVPNTAAPQSNIHDGLATYEAGVERLAARRTRPTPPPERRKLGPGGDWIELSGAEADGRRAAPHRRAEQPSAPQWIAAGAVLLSNKLLDKEDAPSPGEERGVPLIARSGRFSPISSRTTTAIETRSTSFPWRITGAPTRRRVCGKRTAR